jgi:RES domain-containing protein
VAYRAHNPRWEWSPLSGEGARIHGGRFNAKGTPALYLALELSTAILEFNQGLPLRLVPPVTIVSYSVDCDDIVDLTDAAELKRVGVAPADMACAWKLLAETGRPVPSWALADRMRAGGAAGIVVPSYSPGAPTGTKNLVLWHWTDDLPHRVRTYDPEGVLSRDDAS